MPILVTLANAGPVPTAVYRCVFALPVLAVLAVVERRRRGRPATATRGYAVLAGLFLSIDLVLFNHTITDAGAGVSTVIGSLYLPFVAVLAWALLRERPDRRYLIALPVVLAGVILVSGLAGGSGTGPDPAAGVAYALAASAGYACFLLMIRQTAGQTRHVAGQLFDATLGATAGSLLFGLASGGPHLALPWRSLWWLLLLALVVQVAGWLLITASLPGLPASLSALLLLLQPAGSLLLAAVILNQRPTVLQIAGAGLVCCGVLIVSRPSRSKPDSSSEPGGPVVSPAG
jgi:drug/metabolite transporter (DMT)-like permease